jgi:hypothetical protein
VSQSGSYESSLVVVAGVLEMVLDSYGTQLEVGAGVAV